MKPWRAMAMYLLGVILFSALAAPWVYRLLQAWGGAEFPEVLRRVLLLSAILGAVILIRLHGDLSLMKLGLARLPGAWKHVGVGAFVATLSVGVVMATGLATGALRGSDEHTVSRILEVGLVSLAVTIVIAVSEEFFFRGCLLGWLRQRTPPVLALIVVTLFYAFCHFLGVPKTKAHHDSQPPTEEVRWDTGLHTMARYGERLGRDADWVPRFVMLLFIGLTLGWCFLRTSRLYLSIGLHGGWVFAGKMMTVLTDSDRSTSNWWFGYGKTLGSPVTIAVVAAVFVFMVWMCRQPIIRGASPRA